MTIKICKQCNLEKDATEDFYIHSIKGDKIYYKGICKDCHILNSNALAKIRPNYRKETKQAYDKKHYIENRDSVLENQKDYYQNNKEDIKAYQKEYNEINREYITTRGSKYITERNKIDVPFKLRNNVSSLIRETLKKNLSSKGGKSIADYLPFSLDELKTHMEKLFEPWMNWNNWGKYSSKTWDDNNSQTWTWNLDHIIPQSMLPYYSMDDDNFKKCWALQNLRPYSAKLNILDGTNRTRHVA